MGVESSNEVRNAQDLAQNTRKNECGISKIRSIDSLTYFCQLLWPICIVVRVGRNRGTEEQGTRGRREIIIRNCFTIFQYSEESQSQEVETR